MCPNLRMCGQPAALIRVLEFKFIGSLRLCCCIGSDCGSDSARCDRGADCALEGLKRRLKRGVWGTRP